MKQKRDITSSRSVAFSLATVFWKLFTLILSAIFLLLPTTAPRPALKTFLPNFRSKVGSGKLVKPVF